MRVVPPAVFQFALSPISTPVDKDSTLSVHMASDQRSPTAPLPLLILAAWFVPGLGYWMIGQKARALTVGISILGLFLGGLVLGGIRIIEVPMFNERGQYNIRLRGGEPTPLIYKDSRNSGSRPLTRTLPDGSQVPVFEPLGGISSEIRAKPWFIAQILTGPTAIASAAMSVYVAGPKYQDPSSFEQNYPDEPIDTGRQAGMISRAPVVHSRTQDIPTLYTAIAGMLNLVVIIDTAHRAGKAGQ